MSAGSSPPGSGKATPTPSDGPSPLTVATRFVKQYYQVLTTTPEMINRFYQSGRSVLSSGEGSDPTTWSTFEETPDLDRFSSGKKILRFDLDNGAIDAQPSVNGGVLLVVTGHVVQEDSDGNLLRKAFVHTFFLGSSTSTAGKRSYYVHNDVLRFLGAEAASQQQPSPPPATETQPPPAEAPMEEAPGGGVEETKEVMPDEDEDEDEDEEAQVETKDTEEPTKVEEENAVEPAVVEETTATVEKEAIEQVTEDGKEATPAVVERNNTNKEERSRRKSSRGRGEGRKSPQQQSNKPVTSSWASLVASGGSAPAPAAASPKSAAKRTEEKKSKATTTSTAPTTSSPAETKAEKTSPPTAHGGAKRDPDCTLVIKNLPDNTKDTDVISIFEVFAEQTNSKIVGITVALHRSLAFVDFDSVQPVLLAMKTHAKEQIRLQGRTLEVYQKSTEQKARKNARSNYRSGSPGNGGAYRGGGGRSQRRGNAGRGGDRRGGPRGGR